jgi:prolyl-tRNA synthetase
MEDLARISNCTIGGGEILEEPLVVRPTSETIIGYMYSKWIKSYRDLPVLINQWGSVVRWEMRTKLFLRTTEFYWQEGHTAHATSEEAEEETQQMLNVYADFAINDASVPVVAGRKSNSEKFAGAVRSYSIEAMMGDTRALQAGTSHFLGQNFAKAFDIQYLDKNNEFQYVWTTSWGLSTRFIGAIIMTHGDDQGLILPPKLAPIQVVIVPIYKNDEEKSKVLNTVTKVETELIQNFRVKVDSREEVTPGFKFNDWEMRGVPLRIEIGPKDVDKEGVAFARRDLPGKAGKSFVSQDQITAQVAEMMQTIQASLYERALAFRWANTHGPRDYEELKSVVELGWAHAWWCGSDACEAKVKEETKATTRCIPMEQAGGQGTCIVCGEQATEKVIFGRAY